MYFKQRLIPFIIFVILLVAACGCGNQSGKARTYGNDGFQGISNSNPNLHSNRNTNRYSDDTRLIHETLASVNGIHSASVRLNGSYALVVIYVDERMDETDKQRVHSEAYQLVRDTMPRYHVSMLIKGKKLQTFAKRQME